MCSQAAPAGCSSGWTLPGAIGVDVHVNVPLCGSPTRHRPARPARCWRFEFGETNDGASLAARPAGGLRTYHGTACQTSSCARNVLLIRNEFANVHEISYSTVPHPASPAHRRAKLTRTVQEIVRPQSPNEGRGRRAWPGSGLKERQPPNYCVWRSSSSLEPSCPRQGRRPPPC